MARKGAVYKLGEGCDSLSNCPLRDNDWKLANISFGEDFEFAGHQFTLKNAYTFSKEDSPIVTKMYPKRGMPGTEVEFWGTGFKSRNLELSRRRNWYMSRYGFYEQQEEVVVTLATRRVWLPKTTRLTSNALLAIRRSLCHS